MLGLAFVALVAASVTSSGVDAANIPLPVALNTTFEFDGNTSDFAQQYYARYAAGDTLAAMSATEIPDLVQARLDKSNAAAFSDLPGLVQLALLWDSGFVLDPRKDFVQVWTLDGRSMADIFVTKVEYEGAGCKSMECKQPGTTGAVSYRSKICTGTQMLQAAKCVASDIVDIGSLHSAMWVTGSNPSAIPNINILDHSWSDDYDQANYTVYAIHTEKEVVGYDQCPSKNTYGTVAIPCYKRSKINATMMAQMLSPKTSAWVDTWLAAFPKSAVTSSPSSSSAGVTTDTTAETKSSSSSGVGVGAIIGIIAGVLVVVGLIAFFVVRKKKGGNQESGKADEYHDGAVNPNVLLTPNSKHFSQEGVSSSKVMGTSTTGGNLTTMGRHTDEYGSSGANTVLKSLLSDPNLVDNRLVFERIQFQKILSKGAFGEVWICQYEDEQVAVKRLLQSKQHTFEEVRDFTNEIQLSASLNHPNVIKFVGVAWNSLENLVMAVEFLPRGDLQNYLKKNGDLLSWARDKIHMALGIARALAYIHSRSPPLIHRDLKSKNVLLTERLDAKLIDFGVSRNFQHEAMTAGVGTPYWTAPEILEGTVYSEQSDIYSFGVLLSELDTCELPYFAACAPSGEKLKPFQILNDVMAGTLHPSFGAECPPRIRKVADSCFQRDPSKRPTAKELVQLLEG